MTNYASPYEPIVSVLMSVYNGERWLFESITSVLNQTFSNFEFVIVNDGSSDSSRQIIATFASSDSRVRVLDKDNTGLADSLNQGVDFAQGDWIARIDADDICEPHRLAEQVAFVKAYPRTVLLGSGLMEIDEEGRAGLTYRYPEKHAELVLNLERRKPFFAHSSAFFRKESFHRVGCYRSRIKRAEDYDLWLRLSEVGEIACQGAALVRIRKHGGQISYDEGGRRQLLDSHVALASYILRRGGAPDPVGSSASENEFEAFSRFMEFGLDAAKVFDTQALVASVKTELQRGATMTAIAKLLAKPGRLELFLRYLYRRFAGDRIAWKLATKWGWPR